MHLILLCTSVFFVVTENPHSFKRGCLGDHFEKCFLVVTLFVIFFCSSVITGCEAMVMIFLVHAEKGSAVGNRGHRGSLHNTLFSPEPPFCGGGAPLYSHVLFGFDLC